MQKVIKIHGVHYLFFNATGADHTCRNCALNEVTGNKLCNFDCRPESGYFREYLNLTKPKPEYIDPQKCFTHLMSVGAPIIDVTVVNKVSLKVGVISWKITKLTLDEIAETMSINHISHFVPQYPKKHYRISFAGGECVAETENTDPLPKTLVLSQDELRVLKTRLNQMDI